MDILICMQNGYSRAEALELEPSERMAVRFAIAIQNGFKIDWEDGRIYMPEQKSSG
jgi:hypothetical protein